MSNQAEARELFQLQPLLYPALPVDASINPASPAALNRTLRCAEPFGQHLYLGSSDGQIFCFIQPSEEEEDDDSQRGTSGRDFQHVGTRHISSKPIEKILILAKLRVAAVLSEATLTFHELPAFLPIPAQVLPHTKGVASVVLDDEEVHASWREDGGLDAEGLSSLCVVRRKSIMLVKVGIDTWRVVKEIPLPGGAIVARRSGTSLCISTTTEYNMVNLAAATMSPIGLPITQTGDTPSASNRPSIVSIYQQSGRCDFVITSHSQDSTLGVFVSQEGEPTAKLLEWPSHPRALALEYPYLHALLRNDSIEIHNVMTMEKVQTLHLPQMLEPRTLSLATSTMVTTEAGTNARMSVVNVRLIRGGKRVRVPASKPSWREKVLQERRTRSRVLLIGKNAVQCLCTTRLLDTAKRAMARGDYARVKQVVNQAWEQLAGSDVRSEEAVELDYMNQMLALHCLQMLQLEEARTFLARSQLDFRVVLHLFPLLFAGLGAEEAEVEMFADFEEGLGQTENLEQLPTVNLEHNYSPPLDLATDQVLQELHMKLTQRLRRFLRGLLEDYRSKKVKTADRSRDSLLDTCHAKIMVADGERQELAQFLLQDNDCDMQVLEPHLADMGCFSALVKLRQARGDWSGTFALLTGLLDGELQDATFQGSLQDVVALLEQCQDAGLVHQYGLWLVQRDAEAGIRLLTKDKSVSARNNQNTLEELRAIDERAADAFLEYTALSRKQQTAEAHMQLAKSLIARLTAALKQGEERSVMEQLSQEYTQGGYAESFVAHMALRCGQTPTIVQRLKLIMLLQGSTVLDVEEIQASVEEEPLLGFERAILLGKAHRDADALDLLAIRLCDANSAEIYCNQNRHALSSVQLQSLAVEQKELVLYANFYAKSLKKSSRDNKVKLLKVLLQVYMERGVGNEFQVATSHLLNTQSLNLSALEVLNLVPVDWSLSTLDTFLSRSLRKEMQRSNEGQIKRNIALAQNLEVSETLWAKRRGLGGVIEDGTEGSGEEGQAMTGDRGDGVAMDEGQVLVEKALAEKQSTSDVFEVRQGKEGHDGYR